MKLNKYRPNYFTGFDEEYYEINSYDEFLNCELIKPIVERKDFYRFSRSYDPESKKMYLMAELDDGKKFYIVSIVKGDTDIKQLVKFVTTIFNIN